MMPHSLEISAEFWLVFGLGWPCDEAKQAVAHSDKTALDRWAENGRISWKNFERIIDGDREYLSEVSTIYKPTIRDRILRAFRIPFRIRIERR